MPWLARPPSLALPLKGGGNFFENYIQDDPEDGFSSSYPFVPRPRPAPFVIPAKAGIQRTPFP